MSPLSPGLWRQARLSNEWPVKLRVPCNELARTGVFPWGEFAHDLNFLQSLQVLASWHFPAPPWTVGPIKLRFGSQMLICYLQNHSQACPIKWMSKREVRSLSWCTTPQCIQQVLHRSQHFSVRRWKNGWLLKLLTLLPLNLSMYQVLFAGVHLKPLQIVLPARPKSGKSLQHRKRCKSWAAKRNDGHYSLHF